VALRLGACDARLTPVPPGLCDTPVKAMLEHLAAFSAGDDRRFVEAVSLPFVHLWPDGELWHHGVPADIHVLRQYAKAGIDAETFGGSELDEAVLILDGRDLKAFRVTFTRTTRAGGSIGRSAAIWVTVRERGAWRLKLRIGAVPVSP
jgi:hypothetical protein